MSEINKRLLTSFFLLLMLFLSIKNILILSFFLLFIFYEIFYEAYLILYKIIKKKLNLYLSLSFVLVYLTILILFVWLLSLKNNNEEKLFLLLIINVCIFSDIGGFCFGKIFKGKKLTQISPNKTYSGMYGSFIFSLISSIILFKDFLPIQTLIFFSILVSAASQFGDLLISYMKRVSNIKDTGVILPGHGGLLDRFDGLIIAIPIGYILMKFL